MKDNKVISVSIDEWLSNLRGREWLIPQFQRDFVWSIEACAELAQSVLAGRPIGMVTIWEQPDETDLTLEPISLEYGSQVVSFAPSNENPKRFYAVLDGRQRSQAAAMAFGGLATTDRRSKYAGRFVLDTNEREEQPRVRFIDAAALDKISIRSETEFISRGLFPLTSDTHEESTLGVWLRYVTKMNDASIYPDGKLPEAEVLARRAAIVQSAFDGLTRTRLAVYTVPSRYNLGEICEIFETLNTTGTKVSPVDLIHSWLMADTRSLQRPLLLRDWIEEMGEKDGAVGWASKRDRPELFVQMIAGCYLAQESKERPAPRRSSGEAKKVASIKASDLLRLPVAHWLAVRDRADFIAEVLGDFQKVVGDGSAAFPFSATPYPVTAGLYVGLRWKLQIEGADSVPWSVRHLNALFRAFFWRNALSGRYDQGFLTKFGADLETLQELLGVCSAHSSLSAWGEYAEERLGSDPSLAVSRESIASTVADGSVTGALARALRLPMRCRVKNDVLDPTITFAFPNSVAEFHHIFPKQWCNDNSFGPLRSFLVKNEERKPIDAIANLMPLARTSNNTWRASHPAAVIESENLGQGQHKPIWKAAFVDDAMLKLLQQGDGGVLEFWELRCSIIAEDLVRRTHVSVS